MFISGINCNRELIVIMDLEELNDYMAYRTAQEYDKAYNDGYEAGTQDANAKK